VSECPWGSFGFGCEDLHEVALIAAQRPRATPALAGLARVLPGDSGIPLSIVAQVGGQGSLTFRPPAGSACPGRTVQGISEVLGGAKGPSGQEL